jgi:hypothetical protein
MIRFKRAGNPFIHFNLNGRVRNAEAILQVMAKLRQHSIPRMPPWHHAVTS